MLVLSGEIHHLRYLGFSHFEREHATFTNTVIVYVQHNSGRGLAILPEEALKHVNDELHGRVIVIQQQYTIETRLLRLGFRTRDDRSPAVGTVTVILAILHSPGVVLHGFTDIQKFHSLCRALTWDM